MFQNEAMLRGEVVKLAAQIREQQVRIEELEGENRELAGKRHVRRIRRLKATVTSLTKQVESLRNYANRVSNRYDKHGRWECLSCDGEDESHEDGCEYARVAALGEGE